MARRGSKTGPKSRRQDDPDDALGGFMSAAEYAARRAQEEPKPATQGAEDGTAGPAGTDAPPKTDRPRYGDPGPAGRGGDPKRSTKKAPPATDARPAPDVAGDPKEGPADTDDTATDGKAPDDTAPATPQPPKTVPFPDALPPLVRATVEASGIHSLYPPQAEAIEATLGDRNVLVAIPTASGKSLIAHMTVLSRLLKRGGKAIYIVPLRALASEKYEELRELSAHLANTGPDAPRLRVGIATGDLDEADNYLSKFDIIVTTSEKADSLMRHKAGWLGELTCAVADEIHLLGDSYRGPTLEVLLARLKAINPEAQIVGLSATVGNAREIADWLDADHVTSTWRPVALKEGIFHGNAIQFADGSAREVGGTGDAVVRLVVDAVGQGGQALVFVNTRRSTEAVALRAAPKLKKLLTDDDRTVLGEAAERLRHEDGETSRLGEKLADALERGAAFHNAGLSNAQRRTVEDLFRAGHVKAIVATPTLAAGVNLPARRVILRDTTRYEASLGMSAPLPVMEVKQMTGRAGRPRYDPYGEAVLIAKTVDARDTLWETYLQGEPEAVRSRLGTPAALRIHLLSGIATGFTSSRDDIVRFVESTFLRRDPAYSGRWRLEEQVDDVLEFLIEGGFVEEDGETLRATRFGKRTSDLYIDPESSLILREGLRASAAWPDDQTPPDLAVLTLVAATPDVPPLWLRKNDEWVESVAAEHEGLFLRAPGADARDHEYFLAELKTGLLLQDWIDETPLERIEAKYSLGPGDIHNRVRTAEWLLHAAEEFARMERLAIAKQVKDVKRRVHHGVRKDLLKIIALEGIGRQRARTLAAAGYDNLAKLQKAPVPKLVALPRFGPRVVQRLLKQLGRDDEADLGRIKRAARDAGGTKATKGAGDEEGGPDGEGAEVDEGDEGTGGTATDEAARAPPAGPTQTALHTFEDDEHADKDDAKDDAEEEKT